MIFNVEYANDDSSASSYNLALLLAGISAVIFLIKLAESRNRLDYENRFARVISGFFRMIANSWHTKGNDIEITDTAGTILAIGPHRTGFLDANVVASKMKGTPPSFLVTDVYDNIPGVSAIIKLSKSISVKSDKKSSSNGVLEQASKVLDEKGCVAIFPQGNLTKLGQEPPRIYEGAAKLALKNKAPIHVIRLDGFWSVENWLLPMFVRNNSYYRALFSTLHMNNIRVTKCEVIDFHLRLESKISDQQIIDEICARLYAYFRHTNDLTTKKIGVIKEEISDKTHLLIWNKRLQQEGLKKQLAIAKQEEAKLGEPTSIAMRNS